MAWTAIAAVTTRIALGMLLRFTLGEELIDLLKLEEVLRSLLDGLLGRAESRQRLRQALQKAEAEFRERITDPTLRQVFAMFTIADLPSVEEAVAAWRRYPDEAALRQALGKAIADLAPGLDPAALAQAVDHYLEALERALLPQREFTVPILLERLGRLELLLADLKQQLAADPAAREETLRLLREIRDRLPASPDLRPFWAEVLEIRDAIARIEQALAARVPAAPAPGLPDLEGVVFLAGLDPSGALRPVGGLAAKLDAIRRAMPPVHTVVVAAEQEAEAPPERRRPESPLWVRGARTLSEALAAIAAAESTRWGDLPDFGFLFDQYRRLVGREWLDREVDAARRQAATGGPRLLLLVAPAGFGKTAYVVHRARQDPRVVVHFFREGELSRPERMARSLEAQLRRRWALPRTPEEERLSDAERLTRVLQEAGRRAQARGEVQEIWVDGLDEAFEVSAGLRQWLPPEVPPGIFLGFASRPGEHLQGWADPRRARRIDLTEAMDRQQADLEAYLRAVNAEEGLGLAPPLLAALAGAAQGVFLAAILFVRLLRDQPHLREVWAADPAAIPRGLDDYLEWEWERLQSRMERAGLWPAAAAALGLLALLYEPLSLQEVSELLRPIREEGIPGLPGGIAALLEVLPAVLPRIGPWLERRVESRTTPIRWFHRRFPEFIQERLLEVDPRDLHRALMVACAGWEALPPNRPARTYALRYRLRHALAAGDAQALRQALLDPDYIAARLTVDEVLALAADAAAGAQAFPGPGAGDLAVISRFWQRRVNLVPEVRVWLGERWVGWVRMELGNELAGRLGEEGQAVLRAGWRGWGGGKWLVGRLFPWSPAGIRAGCSAWLSLPTGGGWPREAWMARCGCGRWAAGAASGWARAIGGS